MRIPKRYGQSQITACPFCGKQATTKSSQGVPVCAAHKNALLNNLKCLCGSFVDPLSGKWGLFFSCSKCGNVTAKKIFENNQVFDASNKSKSKPSSSTTTKPKQRQYIPPPKPKRIPKEITITSDDPNYF